MKNNRIAVIVGLVVVAAVIGFVAMRGGYPPKNGTEGTIGAADRYTSQQISDADVKIDSPEVQAFIQSDLFHKLATDKAFRTTLEQGYLQDAFGNPKVDALLKDVSSARVLTEEAVQKVGQDLGNGRYTTEELALVMELAAAGKPGAVMDAYSKDSYMKDAILKGDANAVRKIDPALAKNDQLIRKIEDGAFKNAELLDAAMKNADLRSVVSEYANFTAENWASVAEAFNNKPCMDALRMEGVKQMITEGLVSEALSNRTFEQFFMSAEGVRVLEEAVSKVGNGE